MPRIADVLERESHTVDLERGDFERLLGRRERKERNRRIRAGAVGVAVALVMGVILARSLMTSDPIPADPPRRAEPAPAAPGSLAYELDGDIYVADPGRLKRSRSRTVFPTGRTAPTTPTGGPTEQRDRCGRRTGGTSPFATGTVPTRRWGVA